MKLEKKQNLAASLSYSATTTEIILDKMSKDLIQKYNIAGPRYTSYPTVPFWNKEGIDYENWVNTTKRAFIESNQSEGISIYIHLPFCESLCTFCGCHKRITKQHLFGKKPWNVPNASTAQSGGPLGSPPE